MPARRSSASRNVVCHRCQSEPRVRGHRRTPASLAVSSDLVADYFLGEEYVGNHSLGVERAPHATELQGQQAALDTPDKTSRGQQSRRRGPGAASTWRAEGSELRSDSVELRQSGETKVTR